MMEGISAITREIVRLWPLGLALYLIGRVFLVSGRRLYMRDLREDTDEGKVARL